MRTTTRLAWPYDTAIQEMHAARDAVIAGASDGVIFVGEHAEEVVTLGRHASEAQLVARAALDARGVLVRRVERGGGATAHGPGQLVVYPVLHLERAGLDVAGLTRALLEAAADVAVEQGLAAGDLEVRASGAGAGVYVADAKLASVGFRVERGVVTHGLALNVDNDLELFSLIAPCGVIAQPMTSVHKEVADVKQGNSPGARLRIVAERLGHHVERRCVLR